MGKFIIILNEIEGMKNNRINTFVFYFLFLNKTE